MKKSWACMTGLFLSGWLCASCGTSVDKEQMKDSVHSSSAQLDSTKLQEEAYDLGLSVEEVAGMPPEAKTERMQLLLLSCYVALQDSMYVFEITKEEAAKLGIPPVLYDEQVQKVKESNEFIQNAIREGHDLHLADIKADAQAFFRERGKRWW